MRESIEFTILGQAPSKSNCYKIIKLGKHASLAKTPTLKNYEISFITQIPGEYRELQLSEPMKVNLYVSFRSRRSDLDNAAKCILDCLQRGKVIKNDNMVYELHMYKSVDADNPRVLIRIEEY